MKYYIPEIVKNKIFLPNKKQKKHIWILEQNKINAICKEPGSKFVYKRSKGKN